MATRHSTRKVRIFALYNNANEGQHFSIVRSGSWNEVVEYLNKTVHFSGPRSLFIEQTDGSLKPLFA